eukprot:CAMPEP_0201944754 /NCGR_PEP_ID=MMETSP0903-20130614/53547_1 /ASSEMBLY_ACC=CAM_ASM_000552 /TAXON_ID=420261 /ORGANISM="Thalassiosira antarctica, Strain CCMP982" /LENGTH=808 /DNA_ID=CAMNT_0048487809 /DNA_START=718 /DNA_END=3141 /DNA_ORIENTATION=+
MNHIWNLQPDYLHSLTPTSRNSGTGTPFQVILRLLITAKNEQEEKKLSLRRNSDIDKPIGSANTPYRQSMHIADDKPIGIIKNGHQQSIHFVDGNTSFLPSRNSDADAPTVVTLSSEEMLQLEMLQLGREAKTIESVLLFYFSTENEGDVFHHRQYHQLNQTLPWPTFNKATQASISDSYVGHYLQPRNTTIQHIVVLPSPLKLIVEFQASKLLASSSEGEYHILQVLSIVDSDPALLLIVGFNSFPRPPENEGEYQSSSSSTSSSQQSIHFVDGNTSFLPSRNSDADAPAGFISPFRVATLHIMREAKSIQSVSLLYLSTEHERDVFHHRQYQQMNQIQVPRPIFIEATQASITYPRHVGHYLQPTNTTWKHIVLHHWYRQKDSDNPVYQVLFFFSREATSLREGDMDKASVKIIIAYDCCVGNDRRSKSTRTIKQAIKQHYRGCRVGRIHLDQCAEFSLKDIVASSSITRVIVKLGFICALSIVLLLHGFISVVGFGSFTRPPESEGAFGFVKSQLIVVSIFDCNIQHLPWHWTSFVMLLQLLQIEATSSEAISSNEIETGTANRLTIPVVGVDGKASKAPVPKAMSKPHQTSVCEGEETNASKPTVTFVCEGEESGLEIKDENALASGAIFQVTSRSTTQAISLAQIQSRTLTATALCFVRAQRTAPAISVSIDSSSSNIGSNTAASSAATAPDTSEAAASSSQKRRQMQMLINRAQRFTRRIFSQEVVRSMSRVTGTASHHGSFELSAKPCSTRSFVEKESTICFMCITSTYVQNWYTCAPIGSRDRDQTSSSHFTMHRNSGNI